MDILHPTNIQGEAQVHAYAHEVRAYLQELDALKLAGPILNYIRTIHLALSAAVQGNRGIGAVVLHTQDGIVGEGSNTVQDPDNELMHVGHAEINAITKMNLRYGRAVRAMIPQTELVSSTGPCAMCMASAITRKIPSVTTLCPDYSGGVSLEDMAYLFPGYALHIREEHIRYNVADFSDYPVELSRKIPHLAWALSRISLFHFNRKEFECGLNGKQASTTVTEHL